jgi:uncharacterized protein
MRIEIRSDNTVLLEGYVNVTQRESRQLSSPQGPFVEQIAPKAFTRALQKTGSVDFLFNHDYNRKLGSTKTGEISLEEDNIGLRAKAIVSDPEVMDKARKGELRGWSFSFSAVKDAWEQRANSVPKRTVEDLNLYEVSVLDIQPAYIATSVEARGETENRFTETRTEEFEAKVEDNSEKTQNNEDNTTKTDETKQQEEIRANKPDSHYFEHLENELKILALKGGN